MSAVLTAPNFLSLLSRCTCCWKSTLRSRSRYGRDASLSSASTSAVLIAASFYRQPTAWRCCAKPMLRLCSLRACRVHVSGTDCAQFPEFAVQVKVMLEVHVAVAIALRSRNICVGCVHVNSPDCAQFL